MDVSRTKAVERIARVLAGLHLSRNGHGGGSSVSDAVDRSWTEHVEDAVAVLRTLREPDLEMVAAGDAWTWTRMVNAALGESDDRPAAPEGEVYQKPLG